jgi:hypothetical protein
MAMIQIRSTTKESLHALAAGGALYAIVDACGCPAVPEKAAALGPERAFCLYTGESRERAAQAGPYLFHAAGSVFEWIEQTLWNEPWGVLLACKEPISSLGAHLGRFLVVRLPDGKKRAFRFYDPRILKPFLESCNKDQLRTFFGPVRAFGSGHENGADFHTEDYAQTHGASSNFFSNNGHFPISDAQMARFQLVVDERLRDDLMKHLQQKHGSKVAEWPPEVLSERSASAIRRARSYGVNDKESLQNYLSLMVEVGPNFDTHPPIQAMLSDSNIPSELRVRSAVSRVSAAEWQAARGKRDDVEWGSR